MRLTKISEIWGSHSGTYADNCCLACDAMSSDRYVQVVWKNQLLPSQTQQVSEKQQCIQQTTWHYIPQDSYHCKTKSVCKCMWRKYGIPLIAGQLKVFKMYTYLIPEPVPTASPGCSLYLSILISTFFKVLLRVWTALSAIRCATCNHLKTVFSTFYPL